MKKSEFDILIELFIKPGLTFTWNQKDWNAARGAWKQLNKLFPDFDFFYTLNDLYERFNSLFGLLSKNTKNKLITRYKDFEYEKIRNKKYELSENPVIQIQVEQNKKVKNILEYLREEI